jgi:4-coumarate--CoA ligase
LRGGVWEVTALPKNATGKFVRKELGRHKTGLSSLDDVERARL